jgi:hypothetical protein
MITAMTVPVLMTADTFTISENVRGWEKGRWYVRLVFGFLIVILFLHIVVGWW